MTDHTWMFVATLTPIEPDSGYLPPDPIRARSMTELLGAIEWVIYREERGRRFAITWEVAPQFGAGTTATEVPQ